MAKRRTISPVTRWPDENYFKKTPGSQLNFLRRSVQPLGDLSKVCPKKLVVVNGVSNLFYNIPGTLEYKSKQGIKLMDYLEFLSRGEDNKIEILSIYE